MHRALAARPPDLELAPAGATGSRTASLDVCRWQQVLFVDLLTCWSCSDTAFERCVQDSNHALWARSAGQAGFSAMADGFRAHLPWLRGQQLSRSRALVDGTVAVVHGCATALPVVPMYRWLLFTLSKLASVVI